MIIKKNPKQTHARYIWYEPRSVTPVSHLYIGVCHWTGIYTSPHTAAPAMCAQCCCCSSSLFINVRNLYVAYIIIISVAVAAALAVWRLSPDDARPLSRSVRPEIGDRRVCACGCTLIITMSEHHRCRRAGERSK